MRPTLIRAIQSSGLRGVEMSVATVLACGADPTGRVRIGIREIITRSGWQRDAVIAALAALHRADVIRTTCPARGKRAAVYRVNTVLDQVPCGRFGRPLRPSSGQYNRPQGSKITESGLGKTTIRAALDAKMQGANGF